MKPAPCDSWCPVAERIALVSAREALALDEDMPPLVAALRAQGTEVGTPSWDDPAVDWSGYDLAVLRSTWDYVDRIDEFLAWADRCASRTRLVNDPAVVRWNTDKHYLRDLARAAVPVVPTRFAEPGAHAPAELDRFLDESACEDFVVKPAIGAGSRDAARYRRRDRERAGSHLQALLAAGRSAMLQPYLSRVDEHGETATIYLGGHYSHAIRKGPLLRVGDELVAGLFAPEQISVRAADAGELRVAEAALAAIPFEPPTYARVDLIRDARGEPVVLELELTEPSLFLAHAPGAADRYAAILRGSCRSPGLSPASPVY
jgi:O-ureido-D-serine cyclo-ligase